MNRYLGIDIGGTTIKTVLSNEDGEVRQGPTVDTGADPSAQLREVALSLVEENPDLHGIGIVVPGIVDEDAGIVRYAANVDFKGIPLARMVEKATGVPARLGHDGRAAGLAEGVLGAARDASNYAVIPIGTGISAAICVDGDMFAGASYCSGEIGHAPVIPDGELCTCGQRGCMEAYASASAIARRYSAKTGRRASALDVERALGCDPIADEVWADAVQALAIGLTHLTLSVDPEVIIIGGGLSRAGDTLLQPLRDAMAKYLTWRPVPRIVKAQLGDEAGRLGALLLSEMAAGDPIMIARNTA